MATFTEGVIASSLPLTYQHAFEICVALSIRYIWIDSLCIIQDDPADWLSESRKMSDIYSNAFVNIAADASRDRQGGLFNDQTAIGIRRIQAHLSQATYGLFEDREYDFVAGGVVIRGIDKQPLSKRGWVYQERLLSPRILHFTTLGLIWECSTCFATDVFKQGIEVTKHSMEGERKIFDATYWHRNVPPYWHRNVPGEGRETGTLHKVWTDLVSTFSRTLLTYPDDRPVAIQGIVRAVSRQRGMEFIAGLSKEHLLWQLLWESGRDDEKGVHASRRRMPSFTWLSVDGPITFRCVDDLEYHRPLVESMHVQIGELEHTPQGLKQEGLLRFKAVLRPMRLLENVWKEQYTSDIEHVEPLIVEGFEAKNSKGYWSLRADDRPGFSGLQPLPMTYYVIFLVNAEFNFLSSWQGLILEPTDLDRKVFRRIGCCKLYYDATRPEDDEIAAEAWLRKTSSEKVIIGLV